MFNPILTVVEVIPRGYPVLSMASAGACHYVVCAFHGIAQGDPPDALGQDTALPLQFVIIIIIIQIII